MHAPWSTLLVVAQHAVLAFGNLLEACPGHTVSSLVQCAEQHHKSQFAEDVSLLPSLLLSSSRSCVSRHRADHEQKSRSTIEYRIQPTFVELGAYDGVSGSNTFLLEVCCSWKGVLLEANPENWMQLQNSTRNATLVHSGVCDRAGNFSITKKGGVFAGAAETISPMYRHKSFLHAGSVQVPCDRLTSILDRVQQHHVGFMSLDVEGAEELVLQNTDLRRIGILVFEKDRLPVERKARVELLLREAGMMPTNFTIRSNSVWAIAGLPMLSYPLQAYPPRFSQSQLDSAMQEATRRCHENRHDHAR